MKKFNKKKQNKKLTMLSPEYIFAAFITSFIMVNIVFLHLGDFEKLEEYVTKINIFAFWTLLFVIFAVLIYAVYYTRKIEVIPVMLLVSSVCFAGLLGLYYQKDIYFCVGLSVIILVIVKWIVSDDKLNLKDFNPSDKLVFSVAVFLFIFLTFYIVYTTILKYHIYSSSTFDFGIFAQMFENMYRTGLPDTTVERNKLMSHFGVHFSPIFYLLLPGYFLFPRPEYLLIIQGFFVMFGIFAVYGICKKLSFTTKETLAFVIIYGFYPAISNGCYYDFHENKFLTVLILYTVYFCVSKRWMLTILFALLTLGVKEDAAIYIGTLALFFLFQKDKEETVKGKILDNKSLIAIFLLCISVIYYIIAQWVISTLGEGVMMWRLSDYFVSGDESFGSVIRACFYNIGYLIKQVFIEGKLEFIFWMLIPVSFMPFLSKKISVLICLLPMVVINLMPSWVYQYDINFQYTYGVAALIIASSIFVLRELSIKQKRFVLLYSICICIIFTSALTLRRGSIYINNYYESKNKAYAVTKALDEIPNNVNILASTFLVPHLYKNNHNLYALTESTNSLYDSEYILLDTRYPMPKKFAELNFLDSYEFISNTEFLQVYRIKD